MTDSKAPTRAPQVAPDLVGNWILTVTGSISPAAKDLVCIDIVFQITGEPDSPLYGSVNSKGPATSKFALENGMVTGNQNITFDVTMTGLTYQFTGTIKDPEQMLGTVTQLLSAPGVPAEEGSWSAQAQGGGED